MPGSDSETNEKAPKQLPLSEEEIATLETYLEQWDSTAGKERQAVWRDATNEARPKAPSMDAELLRSRKLVSASGHSRWQRPHRVHVKVYRKWLQNHGETKKAKPPITLGRRWTYRSVVESLRKKELLKTIEDKTGVKAGEHGMMNHYSKYLTEMVESLTPKEVEEATQMAIEWNKQGVPAEVQSDIARRKSDDILQYVAKEMFKRAGMRLFMLSAWKNEKGKLMVSR
jgi:hypothetical protein